VGLKSFYWGFGRKEGRRKMGKKILGVVVGVLLLLPSVSIAVTGGACGGPNELPCTTPEPSTVLLIGSAIAALLGFRKALK
jgi:hypothetical protein